MQLTYVFYRVCLWQQGFLFRGVCCIRSTKIASHDIRLARCRISIFIRSVWPSLEQVTRKLFVGLVFYTGISIRAHNEPLSTFLHPQTPRSCFNRLKKNHIDPITAQIPEYFMGKLNKYHGCRCAGYLCSNTFHSKSIAISKLCWTNMYLKTLSV